MAAELTAVVAAVINTVPTVTAILATVALWHYGCFIAVEATSANAAAAVFIYVVTTTVAFMVRFSG